MATTIVLFRNDLRLHDHPALWHALQKGAVVPVYIAKKLQQKPSAEHVWRHFALRSLAKSLETKGSRLIIREGDLQEQLLQLIRETKSDAVYFHNRYDLNEREEDEEVKNTLLANGVDVQTFEGTLLLPPASVRNVKKAIYQIYTSFWKRYWQEQIPAPYPELEDINTGVDIASDSIESLGLLDKKNWWKDMLAHWQIGEQAAIEQWLSFRQQNLFHYKVERDFPAKQIISHLSPHLACGSISARALWASGQSMYHAEQDAERKNEIESFLRQLVWREFSYYQLYHHPTLATSPLRKEFLNFPWINDEDDFTAWKRGLTGYPLVDAGMRELWATGFMHNRVRMVTASFLIKHLLIDWTKGYEWFKYTLVDFNTANNASGWQWVSGAGIDSAPYFRIFNPILQSEKFDGAGDYIRTWVPELRNLPDKYIHAPWKAPTAVLDEADFVKGITYPMPIVDHDFARARALAAYEIIKK